MPALIRPGVFCFTMLAVALISLFLIIVRLGEGPTLEQALIALVLLCAPVLCLRARRRC